MGECWGVGVKSHFPDCLVLMARGGWRGCGIGADAPPTLEQISARALKSSRFSGGKMEGGGGVAAEKGWGER